MFNRKLIAQIKKIFDRSRKKDVEISGIIHQGRIIKTLKGNRESVALPYDKRYDTYFHTHPSDTVAYEDLCLFHCVMPPSGVDLFSHAWTIRAHITEYVFAELGYYTITNPNFNTMDNKTLQAIRIYYTFMVGRYYMRDNVYFVDDGKPYSKTDLANDIQVLLKSINIIDLNLLPDCNSAEGKALGLYIDREFPRRERNYHLPDLMNTLREFQGKKIIQVEFAFWV